MVKARILRHKAWAIAIAILITMPLIAAPFDKTGAVLVAELVSLVVTVGGAALRQWFRQIGARAPVGDGRHIRWGNVAVMAALVFVAMVVGASVVEFITGRPISEVHDTTGCRPTSLARVLVNGAPPRSLPSSSSSTVPSCPAVQGSPAP
jgi:hypothetical protein